MSQGILGLKPPFWGNGTKSKNLRADKSGQWLTSGNYIGLFMAMSTLKGHQ